MVKRLGSRPAVTEVFKRVRCELRYASAQVQDMPALPRAAERPPPRNGFTELFKEEDVRLGWVTVRKTVLTPSSNVLHPFSPLPRLSQLTAMRLHTPLSTSSCFRSFMTCESTLQTGACHSKGGILLHICS